MWFGMQLVSGVAITIAFTPGSCCSLSRTGLTPDTPNFSFLLFPDCVTTLRGSEILTNAALGG